MNSVVPRLAKILKCNGAHWMWVSSIMQPVDSCEMCVCISFQLPRQLNSPNCKLSDPYITYEKRYVSFTTLAIIIFNKNCVFLTERYFFHCAYFDFSWSVVVVAGQARNGLAIDHPNDCRYALSILSFPTSCCFLFGLLLFLGGDFLFNPQHSLTTHILNWTLNGNINWDTA